MASSKHQENGTKNCHRYWLTKDSTSTRSTRASSSTKVVIGCFPPRLTTSLPWIAPTQMPTKSRKHWVQSSIILTDCASVSTSLDTNAILRKYDEDNHEQDPLISNIALYQSIVGSLRCVVQGTSLYHHHALPVLVCTYNEPLNCRQTRSLLRQGNRQMTFLQLRKPHTSTQLVG